MDPRIPLFPLVHPAMANALPEPRRGMTVGALSFSPPPVSLSSLAPPLKCRARVVVMRLRSLNGLLWRYATCEQLPPLSLSQHVRKNALPFEQRRSMGFPLPIIGRLAGCWRLGRHWAMLHQLAATA
jgi:hypothetical protein